MAPRDAPSCRRPARRQTGHPAVFAHGGNVRYPQGTPVLRWSRTRLLQHSVRSASREINQGFENHGGSVQFALGRVVILLQAVLYGSTLMPSVSAAFVVELRLERGRMAWRSMSSILEPGMRRPAVAIGREGSRGRQVHGCHPRPAGQYHRVLNGVLQLAHVARPI